MAGESTNARSVRPPPFTPKRPLSVSALSSDSSTVGRIPRATTPSSLGSARKYKSTLSVESRSRLSQRPRSGLSPVPGTPTKASSYDASRPKTPSTPRSRSRGAESPCPDLPSEMDVTQVDPEEVLVDYQTVEAGDISGEIDEALLTRDHGAEDKVMVSIRIRPSTSPIAWDISEAQSKTLKLFPQYAKSTMSSPPQFNFDEILTGSENKPVYNAVARSHVCAAMDGYNAIVFAYGQTASGKTFTLSGNEEQPGIIPRAMKDVFAFIRRTPTREYLLRCSYLEIYNETIHDLLAPPSSTTSHIVEIHGSGSNVWLSPLREEVVTSLKGVKEVLERGNANRRTATTDWNERSSRSHSVFRLVIESRERADAMSSSGRCTPGPPRPPTPGGPRLQALGGKSVQTSVLSLIDLAGSEKATSDKERTKEGKYINQSLLTLGTVIGTLADNAAKHKTDYVPFRNSKLTRMLQPSLSGNARISVICTINPDTNAVSESTNTLLFAQRIKKVQLNAHKGEVMDTEALLERYRIEIEDLKKKLAEREAEAPAKSRRLSAQEKIEESKAMKDLNSRIQQLTKLILTSQTVEEREASRPGSPAKVDFDMTPYQLQQELLAARREIETQSTQILSLEAALLARPELPPDAPEDSKDKLIAEQAKTIRELEIVVAGYEDNLGEPLRAVREDVEQEWSVKLEKEVKLRKEKEAWAEELVRQLEKERKMRTKLEEQRRALAAFVSKFDALGLGGDLAVPSLPKPPMPAPGGAHQIFAERQRNKSTSFGLSSDFSSNAADSPVKIELIHVKGQPSLLEQMPEEDPWNDVSFEMEPGHDLLGEKENVPA
ncbi:kinesin-domain-containing protein [Gloeophyllum trabeum ATCC 11539]|uniref:Kinesin-like protein n=1 Tax=Gloeophyllum trabeum (strain ATCC 11539 / FP-39264 / Madison 617) TaxID=670483 RepID=S7PU21_GLOTA|nr:kinesin-domain-containing protein [Gloeophyllum trabeum ATCC 11539]EPQ50948.1 kinesin-domain-containing protein [Gloeophyllum trabeum ATCC 11539]